MKKNQKLQSIKKNQKDQVSQYSIKMAERDSGDNAEQQEYLKSDKMQENLEHIGKYFQEVDYTQLLGKLQQVEINTKYQGYIAKANKEAQKMLDLEKKLIPNDIDYDNIPNIASEARQKLNEIRPTTIAQALRISGVNPADISILMVYLKRMNNNE